MGRKVFRQHVTVVVLLVFLVGVFPLTALAQTPNVRTNIQYFLPFNAQGLVVGIAVTGRTSGSCFAGSVADPGRPDAWRCSGAQNQILDPCFENPYHTTPNVLACARDPFDANVVLLTLTQPLPTGQANKVNPAAIPWALALDNSARCTLLTGTSILIAGQRVNYGCSDGGYVLGDPVRGPTLWRVHYFTDTRSSSTIMVDVVTAWF